MRATISKTHAFSASHRLDGLAPGHPCGRLHGHNYAATLEITGEVGPEGFVIDYGDLAPWTRAIDDLLDHRHLNEQVDGQPSAERLAWWLRDLALDLIPALADHRVRVGVSETPKTWAWTP